MEIDPKYADCIIQRWQQYTGKQATLDGDGRTFEPGERFLDAHIEPVAQIVGRPHRGRGGLEALGVSEPADREQTVAQMQQREHTASGR